MKKFLIIWFSFIFSLGEIIYFYVNLNNSLSDMLLFSFSFIIFVIFSIRALISLGKEEKES